MNVCHLLQNNPAEEVWKTLWGITEMRLNHELLKLDDRCRRVGFILFSTSVYS